MISSEIQRPDEYVENHFVENPVPHNFVMLDPRNQRDIELTQELNPVFDELEKSLTDFWAPILELR